MATVMQTPMRGPYAFARRRARRSDRQTNIGDSERAASIALGTLLAVYGLRRRSPLGLVLGGAGALLVVRGATGRSRLYRRLGIEQTGGAVEVVRSVTVNRDREQVYAAWCQLENLPRFMRHLESVTDLGEGRFRWVVRPALPGTPALSWDAELTEQHPPEILAWRSLPGSRVENRGRVTFAPAPGGRGTEVHVAFSYRLPAGLARLIAPVTAQMLKEDIRRLKQMLEAGEVATTKGQPAARAA